MEERSPQFFKDLEDKVANLLNTSKTNINKITPNQTYNKPTDYAIQQNPQ